MFAMVRFVTAAWYSDVACAILENAMDISMALFVVPVLYPLAGRFAEAPAGRPALR